MIPFAEKDNIQTLNQKLTYVFMKFREHSFYRWKWNS